MKKIATLILVCVFMFSLVACTNSPASSNPTSGESVAETPSYPEKDLEIIIPYKVGGTTDLAVRGVLGAIPTSTLDKQVTVTNLVGGSGLIGTEKFLTYDADGYTLGLLNCDLVLNHVNGTTEINPTEDMIPLAVVEQDPYLLLASKNAPFATFADFIAYAEANPGKLIVGVTGVGTVPNMIGTVLKDANLDITSLPYDSATDAVAGVLSGEVDLCISAMAPAVGNMESGDLVPIAVTSVQRSTASPNVPTMAEVDDRFAGVNLLSWIMVAVPTGTPDYAVTFLQNALSDAVASDEYATTRATFYFEPITIEVGDMLTFIADQAAYYATLIN